MVKILSYIIPVDDGAAPNPYHGVCTLAICKPAIRRTAQVGDWVVGFGSKQQRSGNLVNRVVYAMRVDEVVSLREYDRLATRRWPKKIPRYFSTDVKLRSGDCIYDFGGRSLAPLLRKSVHNEGNRKTDLSGKNVLIARNFHYFGSNAIDLPEQLRPIIHQGQGHRKIEDQTHVSAFVDWISRQPIGVNGEPYMKKMVGSGLNSNCRVSCATREGRVAC